ncbi:MAG: ABC transporter ATP-binding protein, partial [Desulfuromonadales bacterium]|nr:ABC transporter ATP-binding protein [Desulfuromonadales bacterium]
MSNEKRDESIPEGFFSRLAHGFSAPIFQEGNSHTAVNYNESRGVGIKIVDLCKSFAGQPVLRDINLEIQPGETFSIIGPSGTGKSVLLKHIVRLLQPDSGQIFVDGQDINAPLADGERRDYRYSMVFQSSALFNSLSVGENVGLWLRENRIFPEARIRQIIKEKLALVNLDGKEEKLTSELSGGMKKRVAIARSLAMNPDLILYDEPTAELDPVTSDELALVITDLKTKVKLTTVIVTHDLNFALYLSDRVAMINPEGIVEIGTPEQIKSSQNPLVRSFIYTTTKGLKGEQ